MNARVVALIIGLVLAAAGARAGAQDSRRPDVTRARARFEQGLVAARSGRWEQARLAFADAYALAPRPLVLFNLAGAEAKTGRLLDASRRYRTFLDDEASADEREARDAASRELLDIQERMPRLTVNAAPERGESVTIDGSSVAPTAIGRALQVDPGDHIVALVRDGRALAQVHVTLAERELRAVRVDAPLDARAQTLAGDHAAGGASGSRDSDEGDGAIMSSPWLWAAVGTVGAALVVSAIVVAASSGGEDETTGSIPPGRIGVP